MLGLPLLLVSYALAMWLPAPGIWMRSLKLGAWFICPPVQIQHLMLGLMLLCAGLTATPGVMLNTLGQFRAIVRVTFLACLVPATAGILAAIALGWLTNVPVGVRLAVLIVAAMPIANSTAGWAAHLGANIGLSLTALMAATILSPWITAPLINLGIYCAGLQNDGADILPAWGSDMSTFFAMWVLAPILIGLSLSWLLPPHWIKLAKPWASRSSLVLLLVLNYVNGTVCLPELVSQPGRFFEPLLAATLLMGIILAAVITGRIWQLRATPTNTSAALVQGTNPRSPISRIIPAKAGLQEGQANKADHVSLLLALFMRNTGAAMVYTSTALASVPVVSLVVVVYTLIQHLLVATIAFDRFGILSDVAIDQLPDADDSPSTSITANQSLG
jgi:bile acid:Na+ symporter, BASS family